MGVSIGVAVIFDSTVGFFVTTDPFIDVFFANAGASLSTSLVAISFSAGAGAMFSSGVVG